MAYKHELPGKKMKKKGVKMPKKGGVKDIRTQVGQNYADVIKQAAAKKKKGKL